MQAAAFQPLLLSRERAAEMAGISLRTLDNLIRDGEVQVRRIKGRCLIPRPQFVEFCTGQRSEEQTRTVAQ